MKFAKKLSLNSKNALLIARDPLYRESSYYYFKPTIPHQMANEQSNERGGPGELRGIRDTVTPDPFPSPASD
jgi:hypothetical protein